MSNIPQIQIGNWYWSVANSTSQVYSSASGDYVSVADATYQAWLSAGNVPINTPSETALVGFFVPYYHVPIRPVNASVLSLYQSAVANSILVNTLALITGKVLFNHENRIRALENKAPITQQQFINAIASLL